MKTYSITKKQACQFLLVKHGLLGDYKFTGKQGISKFVKQVECIQFDPIDVCGKNADLVLFSRIKNYSKLQLDALLYQDRQLVDYFDKNLAIIHVEDWPYFSRSQKKYNYMTRYDNRVDATSKEIKEEIRKRGPLSSKDFAKDKQIIGTWGSKTSLTRAALEHLYFIGELGIHHKNGTIKTYDLIENCIPTRILEMDDPNKTLIEFQTWSLLRRIQSVGLMWNKNSDAFLCIEKLTSATRNKIFSELIETKKIIEVNVEGCKEKLYMAKKDCLLMDEIVKGATYKKRCEFIAPLDNLLWDRKLIKELFGFSYKWEIYTPAVQRQYGHYVLPICYGERFIGRIEAIYTKKTKQLEVKNIWLEDDVKYTKILEKAIQSRIQDLEKMNREEI